MAKPFLISTHTKPSFRNFSGMGGVFKAAYAKRYCREYPDSDGGPWPKYLSCPVRQNTDLETRLLQALGRFKNGTGIRGRLMKAALALKQLALLQLIVLVAVMACCDSAGRLHTFYNHGIFKAQETYKGTWMAVECTLSIIKPDAVAKNLIGQIYARFEGAGLKIIAAKMVHLSQSEAQAFYAVHQGRPFFNDLVAFMTSGPVMVQVLQGEGAVAKNRELMGATDPRQADKGTIRADFAQSIEANAVHGSDAAESAASEIAFFFADMYVFQR